MQTPPDLIAYRYLLIVLLLSIFAASVIGQKRSLDHEDFAIWKHIEDVKVSADGQWVVYREVPGEGDAVAKLYHVDTQQNTILPRAKNPVFTFDNKYLVYITEPFADTLKTLRRAGNEKEDLPGDTLCILNLSSSEIRHVPDVVKVSVPEHWAMITMAMSPGTKG